MTATEHVMTVVRVLDADLGSSHIEPPLREDWDDATKLRWHAAVLTADTGLQVLVHPMELRWGVGYSIQIGGSSHNAVPFGEAWAFISNAAVGAEQIIRLYEPGPDAAYWTPEVT